jgi:hypothetical protein
MSAIDCMNVYLFINAPVFAGPSALRRTAAPAQAPSAG